MRIYIANFFWFINLIVLLGKRPVRTTGQAVQIASLLMEIALGRNGGRILSFVGGPCTLGPGQIVSLDKTEHLRSHNDLEKNRATLFRPACDFYSDMSDRLKANHIILDVFICSLDQVGLLEMSNCVLKTGGLIVMGENFGQSVFKESLRRVFTRISSTSSSSNEELNQLEQDEGQLAMGFGGGIEVITSRDIKLQGCMGPVSSLHKSSESRVSETVVGEGGTYSWSLGGVNDQTTLSFFFEMAGTTTSSSNESKTQQPRRSSRQGGGGNPMMMGGMHNPNDPNQQHQHQQPSMHQHHQQQQQNTRRRYVQFLTHYYNSQGRPRLRVTTIQGRWLEGEIGTPEAKQLIASGFDQECAASLMARYAIFKTKSDDLPTVIRWLDRSLIRLCGKFGNFKENEPSSFKLGSEFTIFPQFMFHLRRSPFLQHVNSSPDESTYYQSTLWRENVNNTLIMIQPSLLSYSFQGFVPVVDEFLW